MSAAPQHSWVFRAKALRVVDGDTLDLDIDQGMHARRIERVRLLDVDAPELTGMTRESGIAARQWVGAWLKFADDIDLIVRTYKSDAFGRYLADIWRAPDGAHLNSDIVTAGMATARVYA